MDRKYYLAVDIGASSGRHMLSHLEDGKMVLEEIYRFPNGMTEKDGHKIWDVDQLFKEILAGMKKCALAGKIPYSMGIDTWAVDFVLLDAKDLSVDGGKGTNAPTVKKSENYADDSGLFSFSSDRKKGTGIYECDNDTACRSEDEGLGPGVD